MINLVVEGEHENIWYDGNQWKEFNDVWYTELNAKFLFFCTSFDHVREIDQVQTKEYPCDDTWLSETLNGNQQYDD